jgi:transposase
MKRRKFTPKFKTKVALEAIRESQSLNNLAIKYDLAPTQISKWKKEFLAGAETIFSGAAASVKSDTETERDRLLRVIGALKVENDFLKKKLEVIPLPERRAMVTDNPALSKSPQCRILGLNRSSLYYEIC